MESGAQPVRGTTATAVLAVEGMHCGSCVALIEETLVEDLGVASATVDLATARATVVYDPSLYTIDDICAAVVAAGYAASPSDDDGPGVAGAGGDR